MSVQFMLGFIAGMQLAALMLVVAFVLKGYQARKRVHKWVAKMTVKELEKELESRREKRTV